MKNLKIAVYIPAYKRPDYTEKCLDSIKSAQKYENVDFYMNAMPSLRKGILDFFNFVKDKDFDFLVKVDNDCLVPKNWMNDILEVFEKSDVDILSPNVAPSNAAYRYGNFDGNLSYRPSKIVGGLWFMKADLINGINFIDYDVTGITGAWCILKQIIVEKEPKIGWVSNVSFQDMGHWSGQSEFHVKSKEHEDYSKEIGRDVAWQS